MANVPRIEDLLAEGEDHVHAGRFVQAEGCAGEVLVRQPRNSQAHYILGLSMLFQKRPAGALESFDLALKGEPANSQFHFVRAMSLAELGRLEDAAGAYAKAIEIRPRFFEALANMGNVLQKLGRLPGAIDAYRRALVLRPDEVPLLAALGTCELGVGRPADARPVLEKAVKLRPDYATALNALANAVAPAGDLPRAIALLRRATELRPDFVEAWTNLGEQLQLAKDDAGAIAALDRALTLEPSNEETRFRRDSIAGHAVDRAPDGFVKNVFDRYAADFDRRLTGDLEYRTPQDIEKFLGPWLATRSELRVVDLGCGTGLSGVFIDGKAARLVGVDLSPKMLARAAERGIYDELVEAEIVSFLDSRPADSCDLAIAADVLVYFGDLRALFRACARVLAPGGAFVLSTEHLDDDSLEFRLAATGRYAHSRRYVVASATAAGLTVANVQPVTIRKEAGAPVRGCLYALEKNAAA